MAVYNIDEIENTLLDNADFEEVASITKAKAFITAATRWLAMRAEAAGNETSSLSVGKQWVNDIRREARIYVAANTSSSRVRFLSVQNGFDR